MINGHWAVVSLKFNRWLTKGMPTEWNTANYPGHHFRKTRLNQQVCLHYYADHATPPKNYKWKDRWLWRIQDLLQNYDRYVNQVQRSAYPKGHKEHDNRNIYNLPVMS